MFLSKSNNIYIYCVNAEGPLKLGSKSCISCVAIMLLLVKCNDIKMVKLQGGSLFIYIHNFFRKFYFIIKIDLLSRNNYFSVNIMPKEYFSFSDL